MSVEEDKKALARYRLDQAEESLDEARYLVSGDKSPRSIINRAYYSMFYAILALLIREPFFIIETQRNPAVFQPQFHQDRHIGQRVGPLG